MAFYIYMCLSVGLLVCLRMFACACLPARLFLRFSQLFNLSDIFSIVLSFILLVLFTVHLHIYCLFLYLSLSTLIHFLPSVKLLIGCVAERWRNREPFTRIKQELGRCHVILYSPQDYPGDE